MDDLMQAAANELAQVIASQHGGTASFREVVLVSETFNGQPVWEGEVHVFDLDGHPKATRAYAWSSPVDGNDRRRFYAVLHLGPIRSARDAVRVAIVAEHRGGRA